MIVSIRLPDERNVSPSSKKECAHTTRPRQHTSPGVQTVPPRGCPGFANHVIWKSCFACVRVVCCSGDSGTVSPLHASAVGCANSGFPAGWCSDLPCDVQVCPFQAVVGLRASPRFSAVGALSPSRQIPGACTADRQATRQVAATQASTSEE